MLIGPGVESYFADLVRGAETFYTPNVIKMALPSTKIAEDLRKLELSPPYALRRPTRSGSQNF